MDTLCRCATECKWIPEQYHLAHHPDCAKVKSDFTFKGGPCLYDKSIHGQPSSYDSHSKEDCFKFVFDLRGYSGE